MPDPEAWDNFRRAESQGAKSPKFLPCAYCDKPTTENNSVVQRGQTVFGDISWKGADDKKVVGTVCKSCQAQFDADFS